MHPSAGSLVIVVCENRPFYVASFVNQFNAKAYLGWHDTISEATARIFGDSLFAGLAAGKTIQDAAVWAESQLNTTQQKEVQNARWRIVGDLGLIVNLKN